MQCERKVNMSGKTVDLSVSFEKNGEKTGKTGKGRTKILSRQTKRRINSQKTRAAK